MQNLTQFAAETEAKADIFTSLGIDWKMLILQIVAFLILVAILGKFVFPWLIKSVDERQENIEAATKAAKKAEEALENNRAEMTTLLEKARSEAADIVDIAKTEAAEIASKSEEKARTTAERIVAEAHEQIDKDVESVKKDLYNETLELVGMATEKVVGATNSAKADRDLIAKAVKESK